MRYNLKMKILINSYPWSGHIDLSATLIRSINYDYNNKPQWPYKDNWIIWKQESILFLPKYSDDTVLCSVIRNPEEVILINIDKILSGYNGQKILGKDFSEGTWINNTNKLFDRDYKIISHQIQQYESYIKCMEKSNNNINIFTYDECKNNIKECVLSIFDKAKVTPSLLNYDKIYFEDTIKHEKSILYYQILEVVKNDKTYNDLEKWYKNLYNFCDPYET